MSDTDEPAHVVGAGEPFMVVDRIAQELITQNLKAALEQLDIIAGALREDGGAVNVSMVYVSTAEARALVDGALRQLPWAPIAAEDGRRPVAGPAPPAPN